MSDGVEQGRMTSYISTWPGNHSAVNLSRLGLKRSAGPLTEILLGWRLEPRVTAPCKLHPAIGPTSSQSANADIEEKDGSSPWQAEAQQRTRKLSPNFPRVNMD